MLIVRSTEDGLEVEVNWRGKIKRPKLPDLPPLGTLITRGAILVLTWEGVRHAPDLWSALVILARTILFGLSG